MSYKKAIDVLPLELLNMIQSYVDGEYIYIPRKEGNRRPWGEITNSKMEMYARNLEICRKYQEGVSVQFLSQTYYLSYKSIQKIISKMKLTL